MNWHPAYIDTLTHAATWPSDRLQVALDSLDVAITQGRALLEYREARAAALRELLHQRKAH